MEWEAFEGLETAQIADLVRRDGGKVCAFPINGTRRWFLLEHPQEAAGGLMEAYLRVTWQRQVELYALLFDHGIDTLLTPIFGPDLLERGDSYRRLIEPGLLWFAHDPEMQAFYERYDIRVRVYGDTQRYLAGAAYGHVLEAFDDVQTRTAAHQTRRLFFGVCAHDATEQVAEIGLAFYQVHSVLPDRKQIVAAYYGEYVKPVDLFIGFDRFAAFDMPLVATGNEDLYFTVAPSPYMDAITLRKILYDHLYARRVGEDYAEISAGEWEALRAFYSSNRHSVLGVGSQYAGGQFWYPRPEVRVPPSWEQERGGDGGPGGVAMDGHRDDH